nr:alpha-mannosidase [Clostridiales bacterium]
VLITFGHGDGGGGPTVKDLEYYKRLKKGIPGTSTAVMGFAGDFLEDIKEKTENKEHMPHWFGELYLEFHRGTYTSQAKNKKYNRKSEFLLEKAETLSYMAESLEGPAYPKDELKNAWETVLLNQFHDIIPGSSIHEVYEVSHKQYEEVKAAGEKAVNDSLKLIADNVSEEGILVYNNNSFTSSSAVKYKDGYIYAENIPAKGYRVIKPSVPEGIIDVTENSIENGTIRLSLDEKGNLSEIYDKRRRRQLLKTGGCGNVLRVYEDLPREYDNWEISSYYKEKHWDIDKVVSVEPVNEGERAGLRITKEYKDSKIVQTVYLYEHSDRIDFDTKIDWKESHLVLKTLFPLDINTNRAVYDIQFGFVERPTHHNTSWDAAKFEVCAHKYCDLSEYGYGVSLINDCKYGHSIYDGVMTLTMLKCGTFPDPEADKCHHEFTYSLCPHAGDFREAGTIQKAYELNVPMDAIEAKGQGNLPSEYSFISCSKENIFIETAKKAEAGDDLIVRTYEGFNMHTDAKVSFGFDAKRAYICDMLENNEREIEIRDNSISLSFKPFEIITIRVEK